MAAASARSNGTGVAAGPGKRWRSPFYREWSPPLLWAALAGYGFFLVWWLVETTVRSRGRGPEIQDDYDVHPFHA